MPSAPANAGRNGPRPRRPDSARSRLPSVLRDSNRRRRNGHPADQVDLVQTTEDPRALPTRSRSTAGVLGPVRCRTSRGRTASHISRPITRHSAACTCAPAHLRRVAELSRSYDQGGACGAAGPASAPGSAFRSRPARRTPGRSSEPRADQGAHTPRYGAAHSHLPRLQLSSSRPPRLGGSLQSRRMRSASADPRPGGH